MKVFAAILWLVTLVCGGFMLLMTHGAANDIPRFPLTGLGDKADHFLAFGLLGGLLCLSIWGLIPSRPSLQALALPALLIYAGIDEWSRNSITTDARLRHWLADAAGSAVAVAGILTLFGLSLLLRRSPRDTAGRRSPAFSSDCPRTCGDRQSR